MRFDLEAKSAKLRERIPAFAGYRASHHRDVDLLLRRFLAGEVEKVRDRLADFIAAGTFDAALRERLGLSLRSVAFLKAEVTPGTPCEWEADALAAEAEERLLDFDLALEEKVAGLHTPVDAMEAAVDAAAVERALELFDEGLAEVDELFRRRREVLAGGREDA